MVRSQGFELRDKVTTIFPGTAVSMMKKVRTKVRKKLRRFYTVKKKTKTHCVYLPSYCACVF